MLKRFIIATLTLMCTTGCSNDYYNMSAKQFESLVTASQKVHIIDVRTPEEYHSGHILGAINIPINDTVAFMDTVDSLREKTPFAVYCRSGVRSAKASSILAKKHFTVYNLKDGILDWEEKRLPIVQ